MELFSSHRVPPITNRLRMKAPSLLPPAAGAAEITADGGGKRDRIDARTARLPMSKAS